MARIPQYEGGVSLDTDRGGMPNVHLDQTLARSIAAFGGALSDVGDRFAEQQDRLQRFKASQSFLQWEQGNQQAYDKAFSEMQPGAEGFHVGVDATMRQRKTDFLSSLPPALQEEYGLRADTALSAWQTKSAEDEVTARNNWFRGELKTTLDNLAGGIDMGGPGALEAYRAQGDEMIQNTTLPAVEKAEILKRWHAGAATAAFNAQLRSDPEGALAAIGFPVANQSPADAGQAAVQPGAGLSAPGRDFSHAAGGDAADILRSEEGFRTNAYWDANAYRVGYGSDTVTKADGTIVRVTKDTVVTKEDAERDLERRTREFASKAASDIGPSWGSLPPRAQAALTSVAYNYGRVPQSVVEAARSGDVNALAGAVAALDANPDRRKREAAIILGGAMPKSGGAVDPKYSALTYSERLALAGDAQKWIKEQDTANKAAAKEAYDAKFNSLMLDIIDGKAGRSDVNSAREAGWLQDFHDVNAAYDAIDKRDKDVNARAAAVAAVIAPGADLNQFSDDDRKTVDLGYQTLGGASGLLAGDSASVGRLMSIYDNTGVVPKSAVNELRRGLASSNPSEVIAALGYAAELSARNPNAFSGNDGAGDLVKAGRMFDHLVYDRGLTPEQAAQRYTDMQSERGKVSEEVRGKEADKEVAKLAVSDVTGALDESSLPFTAPEAGYSPDMQAALLADYREVFRERYVETGDAGIAKAQALGEMKRLYGVTRIGGAAAVMKYPPENFYPAVGGSHSYLSDLVMQTVKQAGVANPTSAFLVATRETRKDIEAGALPRYRLFYTTEEDGQTIYHEATNGLFGVTPLELERARADVKAQLDTMRQGVLDRVTRENNAVAAGRAAIDNAPPGLPDWMKARNAEIAAERARMTPTPARPPSPEAEAKARNLKNERQQRLMRDLRKRGVRGNR